MGQGQNNSAETIYQDRATIRRRGVVAGEMPPGGPGVNRRGRGSRAILAISHKIIALFALFQRNLENRLERTDQERCY